MANGRKPGHNRGRARGGVGKLSAITGGPKAPEIVGRDERRLVMPGPVTRTWVTCPRLRDRELGHEDVKRERENRCPPSCECGGTGGRWERGDPMMTTTKEKRG